MSETRILIVDDEPEMLENLDRLLTDEGYRCWTLSDPTQYREVADEMKPEVLISDIRMPTIDGMTLLTIARADDPKLPVILITGHATVSSAVQAIQEGAFDYLAKPFTADQLFVAVGRAVRYRHLMVENESLRKEVSGRRDPDVVGSSAPFVRLLDRVRRVADTDANVLITGETGTGKELVARAIHRQSRRNKGPFVPVDCAALPEGLLESELFGHEKGAFTGAVTRRKGLLNEGNGGTVLLDEVGELTPPLQAKLLRVLEDRRIRAVGSSSYSDVDIRVVAATNVDLLEATRDGSFREDLYYRLNVVHLRAPPLREREGDVVLLVERFLERFSRAADRDPPVISPDVWQALESYDWPGNVRQLKNLVERIVALNADGRVTASDLPPEVRFAHLEGARRASGVSGLAHLPYAEAKDSALRSFQAGYLQELLDASQGNISRAAEAAGVSRRTLHRWIAELEGASNGSAGEVQGE
jgi:DNA-binding NtrC family response regulator